MVSSAGTFRALDLTFDVTVDGEASVDVADILRDLRADDVPTGAAERSYHFAFSPSEPEQGELFEDDQLIGSGRDRILVDLLVARLTRAILAEASLTALRSTTLRIGDATVVLTGRPRRGKSTLAAKLLLEAGAALVSEEISVVDPGTTTIRAFHRPLGLSERAFQTLGVRIPPESGEPCGCGGKVLVAPEHLGAPLAPAGRPTVVAWIDQTDDALEPTSAAELLARLLEARAASNVVDVPHLDALVQMLAGAHCFSVGCQDLDLAAGWIAQLAERPPPEPAPTVVERAGERIDVFAGTEAVIVTDEVSHHLNPSAAAVWLLRTEGHGPAEIAEQLQADRRLVDGALDELAAAGFA